MHINACVIPGRFNVNILDLVVLPPNLHKAWLQQRPTKDASLVGADIYLAAPFATHDRNNLQKVQVFKLSSDW